MPIKFKEEKCHRKTEISGASMPKVGIDVAYAGKDDEISIVTVSGYIDATTAPALSKTITEQINRSKFKIIVNLAKVDYISSTGWGAFIGDLRFLRENGGDLILTEMQSSVREVFDMMEFSKVLKSFDSVDRARDYFLKEGEPASFRAPILKPEEEIVQTDETRLTLTSEEDSISRDTTARYSIGSYKNEYLNRGQYDLGKTILKIVSEKPYLKVREITKILENPEFGGIKQKRRTVLKELKKMDLETQNKRYEFAFRSRVFEE